MNSRNLSLNFGLPPGSNRILINYWFVLAKRLSEIEKTNLVKGFTNGQTIEDLTQQYNCSKLTVVRNLKRRLGEKKYEELIN